MATYLTLELASGRGIDSPERVSGQLIARGARMRLWQPPMRAGPARATFVFDTDAERDRFVAGLPAYPTLRVLRESAHNSSSIA